MFGLCPIPLQGASRRIRSNDSGKNGGSPVKKIINIFVEGQRQLQHSREFHQRAPGSFHAALGGGGVGGGTESFCS